MKIFFRHSALLIAAILTVIASGCIKNDIPYPRIHANFLTIAAKGQTQAAAIDSLTRNVTLYLGEEVDIYHVQIDTFAITPGAQVVDMDLYEALDLSKPLEVNLRIYQDYTWTITARQTIERYFNVANQIGATVIDVPGRRAVAYVPESVSLDNVKVTGLKLGPKGGTMTPDLNDQTVNFTTGVKVSVDVYGHMQEWTLYVEQTKAVVTTLRADAWTAVAWVYGSGEAGRDNGVEYRVKGDADWTRAPKEWITNDGGSFNARLIHLQPVTTYEARTYSGEDIGNTVEFTTGYAIQPPNASLDSWWLDGKVWCPWAEGGEPWWDTGNKGATTLGASNSMPTDYTSSGTGQAAKLETRFVGIGMIGKLAAGNLFAGRYVKTDGTNGILSFGRPFTERPTRLRGYYQYTSAPISSTTAGFHDLKGRPDSCIVWVALIDSPEPFEIRTNPNNRQLFDPEGDYVVAYGKMETGVSTESYQQFEFKLNYTSTARVPNYILIVASASKYGDYFTGGNGSVLYLDDLELLYDY